MKGFIPVTMLFILSAALNYALVFTCLQDTDQKVKFAQRQFPWFVGNQNNTVAFYKEWSIIYSHS